MPSEGNPAECAISLQNQYVTDTDFDQKSSKSAAPKKQRSFLNGP